MRYFIQMTLSGSTMYVLYMAVKFCLGEKFSNSWKYFMLKAAVLFYLIPLAPLGRYLFVKVDAVRKIYRTDSKVVNMGTGVNVLYYTDAGAILNSNFRMQVFMAVVWGIVIVGILLFSFLFYLRWRKPFDRLAVAKDSDETSDILKDMKKRYGTKRKIGLCCNRLGEKRALTFGSIRPVILCTGDMSKEEKELVFSHEIVHIKRGDVLWKTLMKAARLAHWFNPFSFYLKREFELVCEKSCDDKVLQGKTQFEREKYAMLLIDLAQGKSAQNSWSVAVSGQKRLLRERVENVMNEKTFKRLGKFVSLGIITVAVLVNSLTALAYVPVQDVDIFSEETASSGHWGKGAEFLFVEDGADFQDYAEAGYAEWMLKYHVVYDLQFEDESENIYAAEQPDVETYAECQHQYVSGTYQEHVKNADGGCTLTWYEAYRCRLCGHVEIGKRLSVLYSDECAH